MEIIIAIDDTDHIDKEISTGRIAEIIIEEIEARDLGRCENITRHQLLRHEDIPFTSHNSSMAFKVYTHSKHIEYIKDLVIELLYEYQAEGSDPGFCLLKSDELEDVEKLIDYGYSAKKIILNKEIAYDLAKELKIHLSEHGGTGLGVIGALAGVGLRLSGNDGEFKGNKKIDIDRIKCEDLLTYDFIDEVRHIDGSQIPLNSYITIGDKYKTILENHKSVFLVDNDGGQYRNCTKSEIRKYCNNK